MWKAEHNRSDWSGLGRFWGQPLLSARPLWHSSTSQKEGLLDKRFSNWWPFKISVLDLNENSVRGHFVFRLEIVGSSNLLFPPILSSPLPIWWTEETGARLQQIRRQKHSFNQILGPDLFLAQHPVCSWIWRRIRNLEILSNRIERISSLQRNFFISERDKRALSRMGVLWSVAHLRINMQMAHCSGATRAHLGRTS